MLHTSFCKLKKRIGVVSVIFGVSLCIVCILHYCNNDFWHNFFRHSLPTLVRMVRVTNPLMRMFPYLEPVLLQFCHSLSVSFHSSLIFNIFPSMGISAFTWSVDSGILSWQKSWTITPWGSSKIYSTRSFTGLWSKLSHFDTPIVQVLRPFLVFSVRPTYHSKEMS